MKACRSLLMALAGALVALPVLALEYRAVEAPAAVLYDAPSAKAKKLYIVRRFTPLEVVTKVEGWTKVRDAEGTLAWIDSKTLSDKRQIVVTAAKAEIRKEAAENAPLAFVAEKWVALELLETTQNGWVKVRHRDGASGFVKVIQVWGL